jgi:hypothetical protein
MQRLPFKLDENACADPLPGNVKSDCGGGKLRNSERKNPQSFAGPCGVLRWLPFVNQRIGLAMPVRASGREQF